MNSEYSTDDFVSVDFLQDRKEIHFEPQPETSAEIADSKEHA
jgi:hypothetical protein